MLTTNLKSGLAPESTAFMSSPRALMLSAVAMLLAYIQLYIGVAAVQYFTGTDIALDDLCMWDCGWYSSILDWGYHPIPLGHADRDAANWAFWPVFPLLARASMAVTGLSFPAAAFALNALCNFLIFFTFLRFGSALGLSSSARIGISLLFASSPYFFYLQVPYTEASFHLLLNDSLLGWQMNLPLVAALFGAALAASRLNGLLWAISLAITMLQTHRFNLDMIVRTQFVRILVIAFMPLGTLLYMAYCYVYAGDALAFLNIQIAWGRSFSTFGHSVAKVFIRPSGTEVYWLAMAIATIPLIIWLIKTHRFRAVGIFLALTLFVSAGTNTASLPRYMLSLIYIYIPVYYYLQASPTKKLLVPAAYILFFAFKMHLIFAWFEGDLWVI